jgi:hypothetical protein
MRLGVFRNYRVGFLVVLLLGMGFRALGQDPGCTFTGNSACGGDDHGQCAPQERFYSESCPNGVQNRCFVDNYCASTSKGRTNLTGRWAGGAYNIMQHGDSLYITGGAAGPANGSFIGPYTISVIWPQAHASYTGAIGPQSRIGTQIHWDHPPNNIWTR